jgi:enoyl-CoA hydratase/carnithine racemase
MPKTLQDDIETERDGATLIVRFARPQKKNALTLAMYSRMNAALAEAAEDKTVRAVIFASTSDTFTAGNDLGDFMQAPPTGDDSPVMQFIQRLARFEKPVLATVDGRAIGLGFTMLLHCDFVYASDRAVLTAPFVSLGLVPEAASSLLLPVRIGYLRAAEILLLGEPVTAAQALELGLVSAVLPPEQLMAKALETAQKLAEKPPTALKLTKRLMRDPNVLVERMSLEGGHFRDRLQSAEVAEAIGAFFEKRKPDFSAF